MGDKVRNENFILIQGYMINDLNLKGNELLIYAIINGFSQAENQVFNGSIQYLAEWTNSTKRGVINNLKSLVEKGLLGKNEKFINGVKFCEYYVTNFTTLVKNFQGGSEKSSLGGSEKSSPNNIDINNIENNIEEKKEYIYTQTGSSIPSVPNNEDEILTNEFEKLWKLYPKKVGKEKAFAKYKKYRTSKGDEYCTYDEVLSGLNRYLKYIEQNSWYSPKDGSTWFNNRSWNDEYDLKEDTLPKWFNEKESETEELDENTKNELEKLLNRF